VEVDLSDGEVGLTEEGGDGSVEMLREVEVITGF